MLIFLVSAFKSKLLGTAESEGLMVGVLISCTSSNLSACESTDSHLFGVQADGDQYRLSIYM